MRLTTLIVCMAAFAASAGAQDTILVNLDNVGYGTTIDSPSPGSFDFQAPVESYVQSNGNVVTAPGDPLIGATVSLTAFYGGLDLDDLSDVIVQGLLTIEESPGNSIGFQVLLTPAGINCEFGGANFGTFPRPHRNFVSDNPVNPGDPIAVMSTGTPSAALASFGARVATVGFSCQMELRSLSPGLRRLQSDVAFPPRPFEALVFSQGLGDLAIGVGNITMPEIFNVFTMTLTQPLGTGFEGGIAFDDLSDAIFFMPLGSPPFHVVPTSRNLYCFDLQPGSLPSGITLQFISIQLDLGTEEAQGSSPLQITL